MAKPTFRIEDAARFLRCAPEAGAIAAALTRNCPYVLEVEEPAGSVVPYHSHPQEETVVVFDGVLRFNVEEKLTLVEGGQMIVIRESAVHACASVGDRPARLLVALSGAPRPAGQGAEQEREEGLSGNA